MDVDDFMRLGQVSLQTAVIVSAPMLLLALVAGLAVSIFQAATSISDASLAFIPKILAMIVSLLLFGNFMINRVAAFTTWVYGQIPDMAI